MLKEPAREVDEPGMDTGSLAKLRIVCVFLAYYAMSQVCQSLLPAMSDFVIHRVVQGPALIDLFETFGRWSGNLVLLVLAFAASPFLIRGMFPTDRIQEPEAVEFFETSFRKAGLKTPHLYWIRVEKLGAHNALVCGVGRKRFGLGVSLFVSRSLWEGYERSEFEAVIRHEIAHLRLNHLVKRMGLSFGFLALSAISGLGILISPSRVPELIQFPLKITLVLLAMMIPQLIGIAWVSRRHEYEADAFAVEELGANPEALISALRKLAALNGVDPLARKGLLARWMASHPSFAHRSLALESLGRGGRPVSVSRNWTWIWVAGAAAIGVGVVQGFSFYYREVHRPELLQQAAFRGDVRTVGAILNEGALPDDVSWANEESGTALVGAIRGGKERAVELLLTRGADPNRKDAQGRTPLHWAGTGGEVAIALRLLHKGSDPDIQDRAGNTPLDLAKKRERSRWVELIGARESGAKGRSLAGDRR